MKEKEKYFVDCLKGIGISLYAGGMLALMFGKASLIDGVIVIFSGIVAMTAGYIYISQKEGMS
ncbi:hypothetical protein [Aquifex sp.]